MDSFEYQIVKINGLFKFRATKTLEIEAACTELGAEGWELVCVNYDWLLVSYQLFFKRKINNSSETFSPLTRDEEIVVFN